MNEECRAIQLLLVDDEVGFVDVMKKRLGRRNIQVTAALNGTEAIQVLRRSDFDAAVVDLKMEDMDGIEVLKIFRKMAPDMPVIMLTGHGCEMAAEEGITLGACGYLTKPCGLEELVNAIREAADEAVPKEGNHE
jgi:DNA-binding NtrC family response regulator